MKIIIITIVYLVLISFSLYSKDINVVIKFNEYENEILKLDSISINNKKFDTIKKKYLCLDSNDYQEISTGVSSINNMVNEKNFIILIIIITSLVILLIISFVYTKKYYNQRNRAEEQTKLALESARRAAVSQVMARNMAHNIGSHVLSKFFTKEHLEKILNKKEINQFSWFCKNPEKLDDYEKVMYFNEYLKTRMAFLADIATISPKSESPMSFKYIMSGLFLNTILMNRLSGIDDIEYSFKIPEEYEDVEISIPNDIVGCHALYIIIENIIRNTMKHSISKDSEVKKVEFTINIKDYEKNIKYYEISIYDDISYSKEEINKLVKSRNEMFNKHIIYDDLKVSNDKKYRLRDEGLGTAEMEACAAYLNMLEIEQNVEEHELKLNNDGSVNENERLEKPYLIYAYAEPSTSNHYSLGYKFSLRKPNEMLIITENKDLILKEKELTDIGIVVLNKEEFGNKIKSKEVFTQQFLLYDSNEIEKKYINSIIETDFGRISKRIMIVNDLENKLKCIFENKSNNSISLQFKNDIWIDWGKLVLNDKYPGKEFSIEFIESKYYFGDKSDNKLSINIIEHMKYIEEEDLNYSFIDSFENKHILKTEYLKKDEKYPCNNPEEYKSKYIEAITNSILIIDERIQSDILKMKINNIDFRKILEKMNIHIPDEDLSNKEFSKDSFENCLKNTNLLISNPDNQSSNLLKYDFCIIHLGLLEKIRDFDENIFDRFDRKKIIIISDRGKPTGKLKAERFPFIPFSVIQSLVISNYDKLRLSQVIYNSRIIN